MHLLPIERQKREVDQVVEVALHEENLLLHHIEQKLALVLFAPELENPQKLLLGLLDLPGRHLLILKALPNPAVVLLVLNDAVGGPSVLRNGLEVNFANLERVREERADGLAVVEDLVAQLFACGEQLIVLLELPDLVTVFVDRLGLEGRSLLSVVV